MTDLMIYTDGGARGNPGPSAIAFQIFGSDGKLLASHSEFIGKTTNNVAEYKAVLNALKRAARFAGKEVLCTMDSKLVAMQLRGKYKVKNEHLAELFGKVKEAEKRFRKVSYRHVRRDDIYIKAVDKMLNENLDKVGGDLI